MKIYLASSWKNEEQVNRIAGMLRQHGHEVDAFCDANAGRYVFSFDQLPEVERHNAMTILGEEPVKRAFTEDKKWLDWAECVLLILPAGKSAHLELGYAKGQGKHAIIYQHEFPLGEFDVMYGFADLVTNDLVTVFQFLDEKGGVPMPRTNPELVKDGLVIQVDFYKPGGKWYAGGEVNIGDARLWQGDQAVQRAIIENQQILNGHGWIGHYHVVTADLLRLFARADYHEFNLALWPMGHWTGLRSEYVKEVDNE